MDQQVILGGHKSIKKSELQGEGRRKKAIDTLFHALTLTPRFFCVLLLRIRDRISTLLLILIPLISIPIVACDYCTRNLDRVMSRGEIRVARVF